MKIGWIARDGTFYPAGHNQHSEVAYTMPENSFPAIKLCQNGFAFFEFSAREITQAQLDALFDWTQTESAAESWQVIADFLGIEQE